MSGDVEAYEALIKKYSRYIFSLVNGMTHVSNIEDVAQEVALTVYRNITALRSPYAFTAWLRTLTVNVCRNCNDREKKRAGMDTDMEQLDGVSDDDRESMPEDNLDKKNANKLLYELIDKLPNAQRQVLYLHYREELKYREIAELLNVSTATVGTNIVKAKKSLRKMIEAQAGVKEELLTSLRGAAIGPAIAGAFDCGVSVHITEGSLSKFSSIVMEKAGMIANRVPDHAISGAADATKSTGRGAKIATAASLTVLIGVFVGFFIYNMQEDTPAPPAVVEQETVVYHAVNAEILFEGNDGRGNNVNPVEVALIVGDEEGMPQGWMIAREDGSEAASGTGGSFSVPGDLAPGKYTVTYDIANKDGAVSKAARDFYISEQR